jgi:hypothetical protein
MVTARWRSLVITRRSSSVHSACSRGTSYVSGSRRCNREAWRRWVTRERGVVPRTRSHEPRLFRRTPARGTTRTTTRVEVLQRDPWLLRLLVVAVNRRRDLARALAPHLRHRRVSRRRHSGTRKAGTGDFLRDVTPGEAIELNVVHDVVVDGVVVIAPGPSVTGTIVEAVPSRLRHRPGRLVLNITETTSIAGQPIRLRWSPSKAGRRRRARGITRSGARDSTVTQVVA